MNDCQNVEMREALPELAHGALAESERVRVLLHLEECDDCADELGIIRAVLAISAAPGVNISAIVGAIPPYRAQVHHQRFHVAHLRLAAALLLGAIGVSTLVVEHSRTTAPAAIAQMPPAVSATRPAEGVALVGTADLTDEHLAQLIQSMGQIDAVPPAEPEPITPVMFEGDAS